MTETFDSIFQRHEIIERSPVGVVLTRVTHRQTGKEFTAKIVDLAQGAKHGFSSGDFMQEVSVWQTLKCVHIIKLFRIFINKNFLHFVFEHTLDADVCVEIVNKNRTGLDYNENVIRSYMVSIFSALHHCHGKNIVHRDLRPSSVRIVSADVNGAAKLGRFGSALTLDGNRLEKAGVVGPVHYAAPEVLREKPYGKPADIWSCGVLLFILVSGRRPFNGSYAKAHRDILEGKYDMNSRQWSEVSHSCKNLVRSMLTPDPKRRIKAFDCLRHPWTRSSIAELLEESVEQLKLFNTRRAMEERIREVCHSFDTVFDDTPRFDDKGRDLRKVATERVGNWLEEIHVLYDGPYYDHDYYQELLCDEALCKLLKIFHRINTICKCIDKTPNILHKLNQLLPELRLSNRATKQLQEILTNARFLPELRSSNRATKQLQEILTNAHFLGLLQAHDVICHAVYHYLLPPHRTDPKVKYVQFTRTAEEPLGITLKIVGKACVVARIIHGELMDREGLLKAGDEIREINGVRTIDQTIDNLQKMLREAKGSVILKIVTTGGVVVPSSEMFVRAMFDYNPADDDSLPCSEVGLSFRAGDILLIIKKDDCSWWQAKHIDISDACVGMVPSSEHQEWRAWKLASGEAKSKSWLSRFSTWKKKKEENAKLGAASNQYDSPTYEKVVNMPVFKRKSILLLGVPGVDCRQIKDTLVSRHSERFSSSIPYTTRKQKSGEIQGEQFFFVPDVTMQRNIDANLCFEYDIRKGSMDAIGLDVIRGIIDTGRIPVLDIDVPALKLLRKAEFAPFVVCVRPPSTGLEAARQKWESDIFQSSHQQYIDKTIVNEVDVDTADRVVKAYDSIITTTQWVPVTWVD